MKNILIIANGRIGEHFLEKINQKRVGDNSYVLVAPQDMALPQKVQVSLEVFHIDPTSYSKIRHIYNSRDFSVVYIVLDSLEESGESMKNIRRLDSRVLIVLLDMWDAFKKLEHNSLYILNSNELLANRLYDFLPGVPVVAKNVGLGEGEIMEVMVPFGSPFAYRHVGSIAQVKWKIVAIYRNGKQILPTNATMIRPQDTLLIIGRPQVLDNIFRRIHDKEGMFPEPYGRNLYLMLDMDYDTNKAIKYLKEAIYLHNRLEHTTLVVRVCNPGDFDIIKEIREYENESIYVVVSYDNCIKDGVLESDFSKYDIGMILLSPMTFYNNNLSVRIYDAKKLVYLFGKENIEEVKRSIVMMTTNEEMEAISSISFYISEALELELCLCHYDTDGDFNDKKIVIEHYETLSHIFHYPIKIEQKHVNPIRAVNEMNNVLNILPMYRKMKRISIFSIFSTDIRIHLQSITKHHKLLIPVETT